MIDKLPAVHGFLRIMLRCLHHACQLVPPFRRSLILCCCHCPRFSLLYPRDESRQRKRLCNSRSLVFLSRYLHCSRHAYVPLHEALAILKLEALGARAECLTDDERTGRLCARLVREHPVPRVVLLGVAERLEVLLFLLGQHLLRVVRVHLRVGGPCRRFVLIIRRRQGGGTVPCRG